MREAWGMGGGNAANRPKHAGDRTKASSETEESMHSPNACCSTVMFPIETDSRAMKPCAPATGVSLNYNRVQGQ